MSSARSFNTRGPRLSSSNDDIRQERLNLSLLTSSLLVKTDWNCLFRSSALSSGCE